MRHILALLIVTGVPVAPVSAGVIYELRFDASTYNVNPNDVFDVTVLLRESVTSPDVARLAVGNDDGITSFGFGLDYSSVSGGASGATLGSVGDIAINETVFDDTFFNDLNLDSGSKFSEAVGFTTDAFVGAEFAPVSPDVFEVELATLTFTASAVPGEQTLLTLSNPDVFATGFDTLFADFFAADGVLNFGSATIVNASSTAVPEPSTFALFSLAGIGVVIHRVRTRRRGRPLS